MIGQVLAFVALIAFGGFMAFWSNQKAKASSSLLLVIVLRRADYYASGLQALTEHERLETVAGRAHALQRLATLVRAEDICDGLVTLLHAPSDESAVISRAVWKRVMEIVDAESQILDLGAAPTFAEVSRDSSLELPPDALHSQENQQVGVLGVLLTPPVLLHCSEGAVAVRDALKSLRHVAAPEVVRFFFAPRSGLLSSSEARVLLRRLGELHTPPPPNEGHASVY